MADTLKIKNIDDVKNIFKDIKTPIFYIANSADHGVGLEKIIPNFHIICIDHDDEADYLQKQGVKIFCLEKENGKKNVMFRNSALLLREPQVLEYIRKNSSEYAPPAIVLFKPSAAAEKIASSNNWRILNNSAELTAELEDKLNFPFIAKYLNIKIPDIEIVDLARISYWELKNYYDHFVIQFKKGFAGNSTFFVQSKDDYAEFMEKYFPKEGALRSTPVKVSKFIKGAPATVNACVCSQGVYAGEPCFQITGEPFCTANRGATCGNDWFGFPEKARKKIHEITAIVGKYLVQKKYRGIFGLDMIISEMDGEVYLIEINPRLVASIPFYTKLEIRNNNVPMFALHILDFLGIKYEFQMPEGGKESLKNFGAQMVLRNIGRNNRIVGGKLAAGVYKFQNNELAYMRKGYSIEDIIGKEEFVVLPASAGRVLRPEIDVARLEFLSPLLSEEYHLSADANLLAGEIYKKLNLKSL